MKLAATKTLAAVGVAFLFLVFFGCSDPTPLFNKTLEVGGAEFKFKAGYPIYYYENGNVKSGVLSGKHELDTNGWNVELQDLCQISFYVDGVVASILFSAEHTLNFNNRQFGVYETAIFYASAHVKRITLARGRAITINGERHWLPDRSSVEFAPNGDIVSVEGEFLLEGEE